MTDGPNSNYCFVDPTSVLLKYAHSRSMTIPPKALPNSSTTMGFFSTVALRLAWASNQFWPKVRSVRAQLSGQKWMEA